MLEKFALTYWSHDTVHAQWLENTFNGILWDMSELITQKLIAV